MNIITNIIEPERYNINHVIIKKVTWELRHKVSFNIMRNVDTFVKQFK